MSKPLNSRTRLQTVVNPIRTPSAKLTTGTAGMWQVLTTDMAGMWRVLVVGMAGMWQGLAADMADMWRVLAADVARVWRGLATCSASVWRTMTALMLSSAQSTRRLISVVKDQGSRFARLLRAAHKNPSTRLGGSVYTHRAEFTLAAMLVACLLTTPFIASAEEEADADSTGAATESAEPAEADAADETAEETAEAESSDDADSGGGGVRELRGLTIVGAKETPKSLILVPWKDSNVDVSTDFGSLVDSVEIEPVDRPTLKRKLLFDELTRADLKEARENPKQTDQKAEEGEEEGEEGEEGEEEK